MEGLRKEAGEARDKVAQYMTANQRLEDDLASAKSRLAAMLDSQEEVCSAHPSFCKFPTRLAYPDVQHL